MKKVLIVGSTGYIGSNLKNYLEKNSIEVVDLRNNKIDLKNVEYFDYSILKDLDTIVFAAAVSSPDLCALDYDNSYKVNVKGTSYFISRAIKSGCRIIFLSSDAVYGNDTHIINNELTKPKPVTAYGKMKKEVEDLFLNEPFFKTLRLSYVLSNRDKFVTYLMKCHDEKIKAEIFHPFYRNCIMLNEVMKTILWIINNWENFDCNILNLCGKELVSRIRITDEINRVQDTKIEYNIIFPGEDFFTNRHPITEMSSLFLEDIIPSIKDSFLVRLKNQLEYTGE